MAAQTPRELEAALETAIADATGPEAARLSAALSLWRANPQAWDTVKSVIGGVDHEGTTDPAGWREAFDRAARASPEGAVALYALGNPDLLREATADVVERMRGWGLLGGRVVEIGCGIGRFVAALAPHARHVTGLDISPVMLERAQERCAGLPNVALRLTSGQGLDGVGEASTDLVLAADVFPYLVEAGLAARHVEEAARVLKRGGHLLILNFSYRGDPAQDRAEVAALAERHGFAVQRAAEGDFAHWDAATFLMERR
jgi:SAM-dependent methyltransferase